MHHAPASAFILSDRKMRYHKCKRCPYRTTLFFKIDSHSKSHLLPKTIAIFDCGRSDIAKIKCFKCADFETHDLAQLKHHVRAGHTLPDLKERRYRCLECDFRTFSRYLFLRHKMFVSCRRRAKIKLEPVVVLTRSPVLEARLAALTKVAKNKNKLPTFKTESPKNSKKPYKKVPGGYGCPHCAYVTYNSGNLSKHVLRKHTADSEIPWVHCAHCSQRFKDKEMLKNHLRVHDASMGKRFECDQCEYRAGSRADLNKHKIRRHTDLAEIQWQHCDRCPKKYKDFESLRKHQKKHADPATINWWRCDQCDYKITTKAQLKHHIRVHHLKPDETEWFQCESCSYKTKYSYVLKQHAKMQHSDEIEWHKCEFCSFKTKRKNNLTGHKLRYHLEQSKDEKYLQCPHCPFKAMFKTNINHHVKMTHEFDKENSFQCGHCPFRAKFKHNLNEHILRRHADPDKVQWFQCAQCSYKTKVKSSLKRHTETVHCTKQTLKCEECPFETKSKHSLRNHISAIHTSDEDATWYECPKCDYRSKVKRNLRHHAKRQHSEEIQWFECDQCPFRTTYKTSLKNHHSSFHSDPKTPQCFKCDKCPFKTTLKRYLASHHRVVHQRASQWFECDQCQFRTRHKYALTAHKRKTHENSPVLWIHCPKCPLKFKRDKSLRHHMLLHHTKRSEIQWFRCDQCEFKGVSQDLLDSHLNRIHSEVRFFCALCPYKTSDKRNLVRHFNGPAHRKSE